jgi:hypothetical protein
MSLSTFNKKLHRHDENSSCQYVSYEVSGVAIIRIVIKPGTKSKICGKNKDISWENFSTDPDSGGEFSA